MTERQRLLELLTPDDIFILAGLGGCVFGLTRQLRQQVERAVAEVAPGVELERVRFDREPGRKAA